MAGRIESFRDLKVYRSAFELQQEIFEVTKCMEIGRMLGSMMNKPESFCRQYSR
jgi:hypothetical protein